MVVCLLHVSARPTPVYGEIARHLRSSGHDVWQIQLDKDDNLLWDNGNDPVIVQEGPPRYPANLPGFGLSRLVWTRLRQLVYVRLLRRRLRALRPDIVQVNSSGMQFTSLIPPAMPKETAFILDFRQIGDRRRPTTTVVRVRNKIRAVTRRNAAIHSFDHSCFLHPAGARKGLGSQWERWGTVVPMGVHDSFLNVDRPGNDAHRKSTVVRFIYIGSMVRHRKLETIFSAIRTVADKTDSFQFHFLGRDVSDGYYEDLIMQLQLEQHVKLIPPIPYDEVPQRLIEYDAAIAYVPYEPTDWTYHPTLKVLEYRAAGIPIVATDVAPNREYVEPGLNGFLCTNTAEEFAQAMLQLIEDRPLLAQMKNNAGRLRTGVNWTEVSQMYEDLYCKVLAG